MHEQLEHELTEIVGKEAALVFSTGMQVNLGTISGLVGRRDVAILDKDEHAGIIDGAHLSSGMSNAFAKIIWRILSTSCLRSHRVKVNWSQWMVFSAWKEISPMRSEYTIWHSYR
jgi:7-keto-8-aminopelargonate synthetase-like enzyme